MAKELNPSGESGKHMAKELNPGGESEQRRKWLLVVSIIETDTVFRFILETTRLHL